MAKLTELFLQIFEKKRRTKNCELYQKEFNVQQILSYSFRYVFKENYSL